MIQHWLFIDNEWKLLIERFPFLDKNFQQQIFQCKWEHVVMKTCKTVVNERQTISFSNAYRFRQRFLFNWYSSKTALWLLRSKYKWMSPYQSRFWVHICMHQGYTKLFKNEALILTVHGSKYLLKSEFWVLSLWQIS